MSGMFLYCRPGFESECAAELLACAAEHGVAGHCVAKPGSAYVRLETYPPHAAAELSRVLRLRDLIFARQWFVVTALRNDLPVDDRITPLLDSAAQVPRPVGDLLLEYTDSEGGRPMARLARGLAPHLRDGLRRRGMWHAENGVRLHVCLLSTHAACIGYSDPHNSSAWPGGVPRLRFPSAAPSRSTLKLEEALLRFLDEPQRRRWLQAGMHAVDLGAAPGGWSWQLLRRGMHVIAVDNGAMAESLLDSGLLRHERQDGFRYEPDGTVDWMVCDMVEQPIRVAELAAQWLARGWCRHCIFNLKLPMKKRYLEVQRCLERIDEVLQQAGVACERQCKQLYHDREEITVYLRAV